MRQRIKELTASAVLFALGVCLLAVPAISAEAEAAWALEIVGKEIYTEDTGKNTLRLELRNSHPYESITAFSVAVVRDRGDGRPQLSSQGKDLLPGEVLAPGEIHEMNIGLGRATEGSSSRFAAVQVSPHFEILSDNTAQGDAASIEKTFRHRAVQFLAAQKALLRLTDARQQSLQAPSQEEFWASYWRSEQERLRKALPFVGAVVTDEQSRLKQENEVAIYGYARLSNQLQQRIADGKVDLEEGLDALEMVIRDHLLKPYSEGFRPSDLAALQERGTE